MTQNAVPLNNAALVENARGAAAVFAWDGTAWILNAVNRQVMNAPPTTMEVTRLQGRIHELGGQLTAATNDKEQLERQLTAANERNRGREETIRNGRQAYLNNVNKLMRSNKALKNKLGQLQKEHDQLKNAHNAVKNTHNALKRKRTETKTKLTDTKTKLTDTETKLTDTETKLTTAETRLTDTETKLSAAVEENHTLMKIVTDLNRERKELKEDSIVDNERISELTRHINELEKAVTNGHRRIAELEKEGFDREKYIAERENIHAEFKAEQTPSNF